jgi:hypothetical protein
MGERTEIIPVVQPGAAMEYTLSSSIKKLSLINKSQIGWIQGHGEPSIHAMQQAVQQLSVLYDLTPVRLEDDTGLIDLRTKEVTSRPLKELEDGKRTFVKWLNFLLPIAFVLVVGVVRVEIRRRKRIKRMEEGYV